MLRKFHLISADKKLTHDLIELAGSLVSEPKKPQEAAISCCYYCYGDKLHHAAPFQSCFVVPVVGVYLVSKPSFTKP